MRFVCLMSALGLVACGSASIVVPQDAATRVDRPAADVPAAPVDVPPPPPDLGPPGPRGLGQACENDAQCQSRVCVANGNQAGTCGQPCRRSSECAALGATFSCVFDRSPSRLASVCAEAPATGGADGDACAADGECAAGLCFEGRCHNPCGDNSECPPGWTCAAQAVGATTVGMCGFAPISRVAVESHTLFDGASMVDRGTSERQLLVPPDTVSITWTTQDLEGSNLFAAVSSVTDPDERPLVDLRTWNILNEQQLRTYPSRFQFNAAMWPSRDGVTVEPGAYRSTHLLYNNRGVTSITSRRLRATAIVKRAPGARLGTDWRLRVRIFLIGLSGVNAATAPSNARLQRALGLVRQYFAAASVGFEVVGYTDMTGADASRFAVIDSQQEFRDLLARSASSTGPVLNLFLVRGISSMAGFEHAIGVAGAINGPPGIHGTTQSGVLAGWETTQSFTDFLPITIAHECGHYLGLWHVREGYAACTVPNPPAGTMCSPFGGVDPIGDTPRDDGGSRQYLMHWQTTIGNNNTRISAGQSTVLRANPLIQ